MALATGTASSNAAQPARFIQSEFCISYWHEPPADDHIDDYYRQIAEANFNLALGTHTARTPEMIAQQLRLCEKYGLKAIVSTRGRNDHNPLYESPACVGHHLKDEPSAADFAELGKQVDEMRREWPGRLAFINLYPSHASARQQGVPTYEEYVKRFLSEVHPDVLCFDRYPVMNPDDDERDGYCENLAVIRRHALDAGIPFWNFFNIMPYGRHYDPTEAQVCWQVYTSLAYGARGVLYFCYWTPRGKEFPKGGAIIAADGRPTHHYDQARRLNARLKKLGPTLMKLTSTAVLRIKPGEDAAKNLKEAPITSLTDGDYLIGVFDHADGRRGVLLNNYRFAYTAWPTVAFRGDASRIMEVDPETGREIPLRDDSPDMNGLQISLDAGQGRLFLLPRQ